MMYFAHSIDSNTKTKTYHVGETMRFSEANHAVYIFLDGDELEHVQRKLNVEFNKRTVELFGEAARQAALTFVKF